MAALPGFTIPNDPAGTNPQSELHEFDVQALAAGYNLCGVYTGCEVTATGTPDRNVQVAAGVSIVNGRPAVVAAGAVDCGAAHATLSRYDLIVADAAGAKSVVNGTADANPTKPDYPANKSVLREVWRPAADDTIEADKLTGDKRVMLRFPGPLVVPKPDAGALGWVVPGVDLLIALGAQSFSANFAYYQLIYCASPFHATAISCAVNTTPAAAGKLGRLAIYEADNEAQPVGAPLVDTGTFAVDVIARKTTVIDEWLLGLYLIGFVSDGTPSLRTIGGGSGLGGFAEVTNDIQYRSKMYKSFTFAAWPDPGPKWNAGDVGGNAFHYFAWLQGGPT